MILVASFLLSPNEAYSKKQNSGRVTNVFAAKIHSPAVAQMKTNMGYPE
jgi:hypothetical protein